MVPSSVGVPGPQAQRRGHCSPLHSTPSTLPTGKRKDSEDSDSDSGVWGVLTYMAIGAGGSGRWELDEEGRP